MHRPASVGRLLGLIFILAIGGVLFSTRGAMTDSLTQVTSFASLNSNDSVTWSQVGPDATQLSSTFNANSVGGISITGTLAGGGSLTSVVCPASQCSWGSPGSGGFNAGDTVIWTSDTANGGNGPLTLAFSKSVAGAGAIIQADGPAQFTAQIQAFNGNNSLGSFNTTSDTTGDAVFLGVLDNTGAHITSVVYSLTECTGACTDFAIDTLFINTSGGGKPTATATATSAATPTATATATATATVSPTSTATAGPTSTATTAPTSTPTAPGPTLTATPTATPTAVPTATPMTTMLGVPARINFGNVDASGSSNAHKVSITNRGTVDAMVGTVSVPSVFPIVSGTDMCSNQPLFPKKSCTVMVQFSPVAPVFSSGSLSVPYNGVAPATVALSGNGTVVSVKGPSSVAFGAVAAGSTSPQKLVTITNESKRASVQMGAAPTLSGPFIKGGTDMCSNALIKPRGRCVIGIEFMPPLGSTSKSALSGSLGFDFTYGPNPGNVPTITLTGKVK